MKKSVPSSQETYYVSVTKTNRFMLLKQKIAVCCENHIKREITLCGQNAEFLHVTVHGTFSNYSTLKS
jgi:hypothetical protein